MCEEETTSEPSSPPVESTAKEHDAGGATTVISDSESPLSQRSGSRQEAISLQQVAGYVPLQGEKDCQVQVGHKKIAARGQGDGSQGTISATAPSLLKVAGYVPLEGEKDCQVQGQGNGRQEAISLQQVAGYVPLQGEKDCQLQVGHKKIAARGQESHTDTDSAPPPAPQVQHLLAASLHQTREEEQQQQLAPEGFMDIWADNEAIGYQCLKELLEDKHCKWYVAVDAEFCMKDGVDLWGAPQFPNGHYEQTRKIVDEGDLVQVGFALADSRSGIDPDSFLVFQFNILFEYKARSSGSKNIKFLRDMAKLNLDDHANRGIRLENFVHEINRLGILESTDITWITFQGYSDFGYLIRAVQDSSVLPSSRAEFIRLVKRYFPRSYDLKLLLSLGVRCQKPSRSVPGSGSLKGLAASLGVKRSGQEHGSGSDAHLTLGCFRHLMLSDRAAASELRCYRNIIYGVENPLPGTSGANADADQVHVWASNFDREIRMITGSLDVQGMLTVEVRFTNSTSNQVISYAQACTEASRCKADLAIGFSDNYGRLAYGRIWTFHVEAQQGAEDEEGRRGVTATMLAGLLTNMRSLQNPNVIWLSSTKSCFLYLISLVTRCLPLEEHCFFALWRCFFPNHRVIEHGSPEQDPGRRAIITLQQMVASLQFR